VGAGGESPKRVRIGWPKLGSIPTAPEALEPEDVSRAREARRVGSSTGVATAERALDRHGDNGRVSAFGDVRRLPLKPIWDGIAARVVSGERLSFGVVELDPGAVVQEHVHEHEQLGMVIRGAMRFRVGDETRDLGPGETWTIPSNVRHEATAGPEGAVVIDVFAPARDEWESLQAADERTPRWP
jgi:quercetin dioxygenase-like cupin family protein